MRAFLKHPSKNISANSTICDDVSIRFSTLVPRATLRGVAELHVASGMPQWRMFVTCCYF